MGIPMLGVDVSGIIAREIGATVPVVTLVIVTPGVRDPLNPTAGVNPTEESVVGRGFVDDYTTEQMDNSNVQMGDRLAVLIGDTFPGRPTPKINDKLLAEGKTYYIKKVDRDPAAATYECQIRV